MYENIRVTPHHHHHSMCPKFISNKYFKNSKFEFSRFYCIFKNIGCAVIKPMRQSVLLPTSATHICWCVFIFGPKIANGMGFIIPILRIGLPLGYRL